MFHFCCSCSAEIHLEMPAKQTSGLFYIASQRMDITYSLKENTSLFWPVISAINTFSEKCVHQHCTLSNCHPHC